MERLATLMVMLAPCCSSVGPAWAKPMPLSASRNLKWGINTLHEQVRRHFDLLLTLYKETVYRLGILCESFSSAAAL